MPCNLNQRALAPHVKRGIREAGATPMEFNTIAVSDGVSMGTSGMRASLVSRETIADSIELVARGHLFDGLVCLIACDKTIPAAVMALARLDIPGLVLYTGSIAPGRWRGKDVTIQDVYEQIGAHAAGKITRRRPPRARVGRVPGRRCVRRPVHGEHDGARRSSSSGSARRAETTSPRSTSRRRPRPRKRAARGRPRPPRRAAVADHHEGVARERGRVGRRDGRLDERRAAPRRDREGARDRLHDRRLRRDLGAHADRRRPEAVRPLRRDRRPRGGRGRARRARAREGAGSSTRRGATSTDGRSARSPRRPSRRRARRWSSRSRRRSSPRGGIAILRGNLAPDGCVRQARRRTTARSTAGRRASSTPRRRRSPR